MPRLAAHHLKGEVRHFPQQRQEPAPEPEAEGVTEITLYYESDASGWVSETFYSLDEFRARWQFLDGHGGVLRMCARGLVDGLHNIWNTGIIWREVDAWEKARFDRLAAVLNRPVVHV